MYIILVIIGAFNLTMAFYPALPTNQPLSLFFCSLLVLSDICLTFNTFNAFFV